MDLYIHMNSMFFYCIAEVSGKIWLRSRKEKLHNLKHVSTSIRFCSTIPYAHTNRLSAWSYLKIEKNILNSILK